MYDNAVIRHCSYYTCGCNGSNSNCVCINCTALFPQRIIQNNTKTTIFKNTETRENRGKGNRGKENTKVKED